MKNTDPLMGAKLKSKTHLQNTFFDFLSCFLSVWLQSLKKVLIWPKKFFFEKKSKKVSKTQISRWFRIRWKNCYKMHKKKVISKTSLTNMSKSEKSAFFHHVFANNFFLVHFSKLFQWFWNQRKILHFLPLFWLKKKKFRSY